MKEIYKINLHNLVEVISVERVYIVSEDIDFILNYNGCYASADECFVDVLYNGEKHRMYEKYKSIIINHKRVEKLNELYE